MGEIFFPGKNFLKKVLPWPPSQKLSDEMEKHSWVQNRSTKPAVQRTVV